MGRAYGSLTKAERDETDAACSGSHSRMYELEVYRRSDGKAVGSFTAKYMGGSASGDLDRQPIVNFECQLLDPEVEVDWSGGRHSQFEVRLIDSRFVPALNDWVDMPGFHGTVVSFDRSGALVSLHAEGPEYNAMGSVRHSDTWKASARATFVLSELLRRAGAESSDLRIPSRKTRLPNDVTVGVKVGKDLERTEKDDRRTVQRLRISSKDSYLSVAAPIAEALDCDFFGDQFGRLVMESPKVRPTLRLDESVLLGPVSEKPETEGAVTNVWIVRGPDPKGKKDAPSARAELPKSHPSSARQQQWNGTEREEISKKEVRHVKTDKQAAKLARRSRDRAMRESVAYDVECVPVTAWLRPGGLVSLPTSAGRTTSRIRQWTIPFTFDADPMVLGSTRSRSVSK